MEVPQELLNEVGLAWNYYLEENNINVVPIKVIKDYFDSIPVEKPVKPEIAEDFKLLKELAEGELLAYDIYPPKDEVQKIHKERWEEALKNVKKYFR